MNSKIINRNPFIKLVTPLILGILLQEYLTLPTSLAVFFLFLMLLILLTFRKNKKINFTIFILIFFAGYIEGKLKEKEVTYPFSKKEKLYKCKILSLPKSTSKTKRYKANLISEYEFGKRKDINKDIYVYIRKGAQNALPTINDIIVFKSKINPYKLKAKDKKKNQYERYLFHKGITGYSFIANNKYKVIKNQHQSYTEKLGREKVKIIKLYNTIVSSENSQILSAITLGEKSNLNKKIKNEFSNSGVSHLLALSGLHLGIIYFFLNSLLFTFGKKCLILIKKIILILTIWLFAIFTGLSASIIRATIMLTFLSIFGNKENKEKHLNLVLATAFIILIINPWMIYDIGFQLSFISVIGILSLTPIILKYKLSSKNKLIDKVQNLIIISISAQIATMPLCIYYFSNIPILFLATNLIGIPLVTAIIYLGIIVIALGTFTIHCDTINHILNLSLTILHKTTVYISNLPYSSINNINLSFFECIIIYVLYILAANYQLNHSHNIFIISLSILCFLLLYHLIYWKSFCIFVA